MVRLIHRKIRSQPKGIFEYDANAEMLFMRHCCMRYMSLKTTDSENTLLRSALGIINLHVGDYQAIKDLYHRAKTAVKSLLCYLLFTILV